MATAPDYWTETLSKMLLRMEQNAHLRRWDQDPYLASIIESRIGVLTLEPTDVQIQNPPGEFLQALGQYLTDGSAPAAFLTSTVACDSQWRGFALVQESREIALPQLDGRRIMTADVWGNVGWVRRIRDEKPTVVLGQGGRVADALIAMTKAVAVKLPESQCDLAKLLSLRAPSEEWVADQD